MPDSESSSSASTSSTVANPASSPVSSDVGAGAGPSPVKAPFNDTYSGETRVFTSQPREEISNVRSRPVNDVLDKSVYNDRYLARRAERLSKLGYRAAKKFEDEEVDQNRKRRKKVVINPYNGAKGEGMPGRSNSTNWVSLNSSFLSAARCTRGASVIDIRFSNFKVVNYEFGGPARARSIFKGLVEASSPGSYYNNEIKGSQRSSATSFKSKPQPRAKKTETYRTKSNFGSDDIQVDTTFKIKSPKNQQQSQSANFISNMADAGELAITTASILGKIKGGYGVAGYAITGLVKHFAETRGGKSHRGLELATNITLGAQVGLSMNGAIANASGKARFAGKVWAKTPFGKVGRTPAGQWSAQATAAQVGKAASLAARYGFQKAYVAHKMRFAGRFTPKISRGTRLMSEKISPVVIPKKIYNRRSFELKSFYKNKVKIDPALQRWTRGIGLATGAGVAFILQDKNSKIELAPYIGAALTAGIAGYGLYKTKSFKKFKYNVMRGYNSTK